MHVFRILIVDYEKLARIGIRTFLSEHPCCRVVGEADSGELGLSLIAEDPPDVIVLDLLLPGMDGIEVTRHIKRHHRDIKVIILTSHEVEAQILAALSAGADAYCLKAGVSGRLADVVNCVMEGGAWLDPMIARKVVDVLSSGVARDLRKIEASKNENHKALGLTGRESQILSLIVAGKNNAEIAQKLFVSYHTVKSDVTSILQKLSVHDRVQAAVKALKENLV